MINSARIKIEQFRFDSMKFRILFVILFLFGTITCFYYSGWILHNKFHYNGEAFHKGYGHILRETMTLGIRLLIFRYFLAFMFFFLFILQLTESEQFKIVKRILWIWTGLMLLFSAGVAYKIHDIVVHEWDGTERTLEISLSWYLPWLSAITAFQITRLIEKLKLT